MCDATCSESGHLLTIKPCGWYLKLQSDRDRLAGVVAGMAEQGQRNIEALRRAEAEVESLFEVVDNLVVDNDVYATRNVSLCTLNSSLLDEIEIVKREHQEHCAESYNNAVRQITARKEDNARLREALNEVSNLVSASKDQSADHTKALFHIGRLAGNALKEVG